jgi:hypothetical protein
MSVFNKDLEGKTPDKITVVVLDSTLKFKDEASCS